MFQQTTNTGERASTKANTPIASAPDQALNTAFGAKRSAEPRASSHDFSRSTVRTGHADTTLIRDIAITTGTAVALALFGASWGWAIGLGAITCFGARFYLANKDSFSKKPQEPAKS